MYRREKMFERVLSECVCVCVFFPQQCAYQSAFFPLDSSKKHEPTKEQTNEREKKNCQRENRGKNKARE